MTFITSRTVASGAMLLAATLLPSTASVAGTTSGTLSVSATVTANCTVSTSALAFGNVSTISGSDVDGTGGLAVTCTNGTAWTATAGLGAGTGATFAARRMTAGANHLSYNLYTDASRSAIWGDGTASTSTITGTGTGAGQNVSIYGRVGSGQASVPAGSYADTVAVTVSY